MTTPASKLLQGLHHHLIAHRFRLAGRLLLTGWIFAGSGVAALAACAPAADGLVGWWRAEGDTVNMVGANSGTLQGQATFGTGQVGQCFVFDGDGDGVVVGTAASYQF